MTMKGWTDPAAPKKGQRKNASNTGMKAEDVIKKHILIPYEEQGIALIEKVDPPSKVFRGKPCFMKNPFLDFTGTWKGNSIQVEAKSAKANRLPINKDGGVTKAQWGNMQKWDRHGAIVLLLWIKDSGVKMFTMCMIHEAIDRGEKSLPWDYGLACPAGRGTIADFLLVAEDALNNEQCMTQTKTVIGFNTGKDREAFHEKMKERIKYYDSWDKEAVERELFDRLSEQINSNQDLEYEISKFDSVSGRAHSIGIDIDDLEVIES